MATTSTEAKVGLFFLGGVLLLALLTLRVGALDFLFKREYDLHVRFLHAAGLKAGDTVAVEGVKMGQIKSVQLVSPAELRKLEAEAIGTNVPVRPVEIVFSVNRNAVIKSDSVAAIAWGGLLGNRYIDITLGSPDAPALQEGDEVLNVAPSLEITDVLAKIDAAAATLQNMLQGEGPGGKFTELVENLRKVSEDLAQHKGTIGKLIGDDEMYNKLMSIGDDLKDASGRVSKLVSGNEGRIEKIMKGLEEAAPEARDAFAEIKKLGERIENGKGLLPGLLNDEQMYKDFRASMAKLSVSLDRIEQVAKNMQEGEGLIGKLANDKKLAEDFGAGVSSLRAVAERLEKGDGTLARLTRDDDMYKDMKKVLDDAKETLRTAREQVPVGTFASVLLSVF